MCPTSPSCPAGCAGELCPSQIQPALVSPSGEAVLWCLLLCRKEFAEGSSPRGKDPSWKHPDCPWGCLGIEQGVLNSKSGRSQMLEVFCGKKGTSSESGLLFFHSGTYFLCVEQEAGQPLVPIHPRQRAPVTSWQAWGQGVPHHPFCLGAPAEKWVLLCQIY